MGVLGFCDFELESIKLVQQEQWKVDVLPSEIPLSVFAATQLQQMYPHLEAIQSKVAPGIRISALQSGYLLVADILLLLTQEVKRNSIQFIRAFTWQTGMALADVVEYVQQQAAFISWACQKMWYSRAESLRHS